MHSRCWCQRGTLHHLMGTSMRPSGSPDIFPSATDTSCSGKHELRALSLTDLLCWSRPTKQGRLSQHEGRLQPGCASGGGGSWSPTPCPPWPLEARGASLRRAIPHGGRLLSRQSSPSPHWFISCIVWYSLLTSLKDSYRKLFIRGRFTLQNTVIH